MFIPKGNILIDEVSLPFEELEPMLNNLQNDGFTGYVLIKTTDSSSYIFMNGGQMDKAIDVDAASDAINVYYVQRLLNRVQNKQLLVSTYVLSSRMVSVLSMFFAFQQQYAEYEVRRRDFAKVLEGLESSQSSGFIKVATKSSAYFLLLSGGEVLSDRFSRQYGEIVCGVDEVKARFDEIERNGATISVYAEKDEEIENRRIQKDDELEKIKELMIRAETRFLGGGDVVKVDDYVVRGWGIDAKASFNVEVENQNGDVYEYKCQAAKRMGGYAGVTKAMMERMGVSENEMVFVKPI
ncbi:hypothetical protein IJT17_08580 [bacterium]|nr:hypothetical protein [bacterium]